jgi:ribosomal protein S17
MSTLPISKACKKRRRRKENRQDRLNENNELLSTDQNIKMVIEKKGKNIENIKMTSKIRRKMLRVKKFGIHNESVELKNGNTIEENTDKCNDGSKVKFINKTLWCLHPNCLESIISFNSEEDLQLHTEKEHLS